MEHILKSWPNFLRFIMGLLVIFIAIVYIVSQLSDNIKFHVDYNTDKTLITFTDKKNVIANSVLPACDCWTNTGIEIRPEEEFEIKVAGKIQTAMDKVVKDAEDDIQPRFPWIGPEGYNFRIREDMKHKFSDSLRKTLLLTQKANLGQVLFFIQKGSMKPNCDLNSVPFIPDSLEVYDVENGLRGKNDTKTTWHIWATINDMLIRNFQDINNKIAYLGGATGDTLKRKQFQWNTLAQEKYNRLWFDDNVGNFVISAKIEKPNHFWNF